MISFAVQKIFNFIKSHLFIFAWLGVPIYVIFEQFKDHNIQLVIFMAFFDSLVLGFS